MNVIFSWLFISKDILSKVDWFFGRLFLWEAYVIVLCFYRNIKYKKNSDVVKFGYNKFTNTKDLSIFSALYMQYIGSIVQQQEKKNILSKV